MEATPSTPPAQGRIFYDGDCGLCHGAVRFVSKRQTSDCPFRFAPLAGTTFAQTVSEAERRDLPDSIVVQTSEGAMLIRSTAALYVMRRLGPGWKWMAAVLSIVPRRAADAVYDLVARNRFRLFDRPESTCPMLPENARRCLDP